VSRRRSWKRPPARMSEAAAAVWRQVAPQLAANGVLTDTTAPVLEAWCTAVARWREMSELLDRTGLLVLEGGEYRPSPALRILSTLEASILRLGAHLSLKAKPRSDDGDDDDLRELLAIAALPTTPLGDEA
jgi:P27 family predicted phage terminase small subunit